MRATKPISWGLVLVLIAALSACGGSRVARVEPRLTEPAPSTPPPAAARSSLWSDLESLADRGAVPLRLSLNQGRFKIGDTLVIACQAPRAGYLNVLNVGRDDQEVTVLFPNSHHPDNRVPANAVILIPAPGDDFVLRVTPPVGPNLIVAIHTPQELNLYRDGQGAINDLFKTLRVQTLVRLEREQKRAGGDFGAAKVITQVDQ
ncbi:MAG: DUF4384 domain-containing protein [Thermodesulfobacteriota bacterium]